LDADLYAIVHLIHAHTLDCMEFLRIPPGDNLRRACVPQAVLSSCRKRTGSGRSRLYQALWLLGFDFSYVIYVKRMSSLPTTSYIQFVPSAVPALVKHNPSLRAHYGSLCGS
jgi:hypothetical protein